MTVLATAIVQGPWGDAPLLTLLCVVLGLICSLSIWADDPTDCLSPLKLAAGLYAASFSIGPLLLAGEGAYEGRYFGYAGGEDQEAAAAIVLWGWLCILAGYIGAKGRRRRRPAVDGPDPWSWAPTYMRYLRVVGMGLLGAGLACYVILLARSGGLGYFLSYSGGRADIFRGVYGGWFWGTHFLVAGYSVLAVAFMRRRPWLCAAGALGIGGLFFLFQGRDMVIAPLACWFLVYHYVRKPFDWRVVAVSSLAVLALAALVGAYRQANKETVLADPGAFVLEFGNRLGEQVTVTFAASIEQLDTVLIAQRYLSQGNAAIGPMALLTWFEPIDRFLFGDSIPTIYTGVFMDRLVFPEHTGWNTALSPSLPGELLISLGVIGTTAGMGLFGMALGVLERWRRVIMTSPLLFAAYPFTAYIVVKMLLDGTAHVFRIVVCAVPILVAFALAPSARRREARS